MAKGKKTGGRNFLKGVSGNPMGRPVTPVELKALKSQWSAQLMSAFLEHLSLTREQIKQRLKNKSTVAYELMVGKFILAAIDKADPRYTNLIFDRIIGRANLATDDGCGEESNLNQESMHKALADFLSETAS